MIDVLIALIFGIMSSVYWCFAYAMWVRIAEIRSVLKDLNRAPVNEYEDL